MGLKAPGILLFLISVILSVVVLISRFFGADVPFLQADSTQFYGLLAAYLLLVVGNLGGI
ncbi:MAG: hypothetical protein AAFR04_11345 [Pseudomonadota bacterium]